MTNLNPYLRFITCTSNLPNKRHTIAYDCRLFYVLSGSGKIITDEQTLDLSADTLLYYPSGIRYFLKSNSTEPMKFFTVNFDFTNTYHQKSVMPPVYAENCDFSLVQPSHKQFGQERFFSPFIINNAAYLRSYFVRLTELYREGGKYSEALTSSLLRVVILEILQGRSTCASSNKIVQKAKAFIDEHYSEHLTNGSIAAALKYHPYYLGVLFRRYLGKTTHEYLNEVRLNQATEMLALTDNTIYEITEACGFKTPEHLTKLFKKHYGQTPTEWRKSRVLI